MALALAAVAVLIQTIALGAFPWLGLMLAATFCLYGFLRKTIPVGPTQGFLIETGILALPCWPRSTGSSRKAWRASAATPSDTLMLIGCGVMTATALILFAASIRRIRYSTAGLLQYISPSLVFLTAVFVFGEHLDVWKLASFIIIWVALAIFSISALRDERSRRRSEEPEPEPV